MIRTVCICLPEYPEQIKAAQEHFVASGLEGTEFMWAVNASLAGLATSHTYDVDHPGTNFRMGAKPTGIWIAHIMAWTMVMTYPDDHIMILETDAKFQDGWKEKFEQAMQDMPSNGDFLHPGSCCVEGHDKKHVKGLVWETKHCQCTHCYVVRRGCLPFLLRTIRKCYAPIDCQMIMEAFPYLNTYAILPRIVDQFNTVLSP